MYFQNLPQEFQERIINGLKKDLKNLARAEGYNCNNEYIDDYINRNNDHDTVRNWINCYCL